MSESKNASALIRRIVEVLNKAQIMMPGGSKLVIIVSCLEPEFGENMVAESVLRFGCDPCEGAHLMARCIVQHNEEHHSDEGDDPPAHGILQ